MVFGIAGAAKITTSTVKTLLGFLVYIYFSIFPSIYKGGGCPLYMLHGKEMGIQVILCELEYGALVHPS